jgi:hypothetical protein
MSPVHITERIGGMWLFPAVKLVAGSLLVLCLGLLAPMHAGAQTALFGDAEAAAQKDTVRVFGTFSVTGGNSAGKNQLVTLHVRLVNASEVDLSSAKWALGAPSTTRSNLHDLPSPGLLAHRDSTFTYEETLSRVEYELLSVRGRMFLTLEFQNQDGEPVRQLIALRYVAATSRGY